jgi:hypothetical protein
MCQIFKIRIKIKINKVINLVIQTTQEVILEKIFNNFQVGKEIARMFVTYKISIQMKRHLVDCFKFNLIMNLKLDFKKYILLTAYLTLIRCSMII